MSKPVLTLILVASISLIALAANADPDGPGYGQDPGAEPPRTGVGSANSGNHEMHIKNHRNRWSYGVDEDSTDMDGVGPVDRLIEPTYLPFAGSVFYLGRVIDLAIFR